MVIKGKVLQDKLISKEEHVGLINMSPIAEAAHGWQATG